MLNERRASKLHGILLITLFSFAAFYIADFEFVKRLSLSPLIVGIVLGILYANSLRNHLPQTWVPGITFCTKFVLRAGIIMYGFRLTYQQVMQIGLPAIVIDTIIVLFTIIIGVIFGRLLKMDRDISLLTSTGSAICGAAAVLGAEPIVRSEPHKTAVAVSTVVIFGTLSMFLYPVFYRSGVFDLTPEQMGLYTGATLHEVAHVAGAGNAMGEAISDPAVIVKMIRVLLLAPALLVMSIVLARIPAKSAGTTECRRRVTIPWFAVGFVIVIAFNSLNLLPRETVDTINTFDTFLLTMAMTALGAETSIDKFKKAGSRPFVLALILYAWLVIGGYLLVKYLTPILS